MIITFCKFER